MRKRIHNKPLKLTILQRVNVENLQPFTATRVDKVHVSQLHHKPLR